MPPVTDAHLQAAFQLMAWRGWTLEAALRDPIRAKVLRARAAHLRTQEWKAKQAEAVTQNVRRFNPATGQWVTQRVQTGWASDVQRLI